MQEELKDTIGTTLEKLSEFSDDEIEYASQIVHSLDTLLSIEKAKRRTQKER